MAKKEILRRCVVTHEQKDKSELIRVVRLKNGEVVLDTGERTYGRGAYISRDKEVLEKAKDTNALGKALGVKIPPSIYTKIEELLSE